MFFICQTEMGGHQLGVNGLDLVPRSEGCMSVICGPTDFRGHAIALLLTIADKNHLAESVQAEWNNKNLPCRTRDANLQFPYFTRLGQVAHVVGKSVLYLQRISCCIKRDIQETIYVDARRCEGDCRLCWIRSLTPSSLDMRRFLCVRGLGCSNPSGIAPSRGRNVDAWRNNYLVTQIKRCKDLQILIGMFCTNEGHGERALGWSRPLRERGWYQP